MEEFEKKWWDDLVKQALESRGARNLSGNNVEELISYVSDKPYMLVRVEAKRIEPKYDRDMPNYSIYGCLPPSDKGIEIDKAHMISLFRELNSAAQKEETYAMRFDVWFAEVDVEKTEKGSQSKRRAD